VRTEKQLLAERVFGAPPSQHLPEGPARTPPPAPPLTR
jgi:hypothetical protein